MIFDIILCVVLICAFLIGTQRGLLSTIWGLAALIISIVLASILHPFAVEAFKESSVGNSINNYVHEKISENISAPDTDEMYMLPEKFLQNIDTATEENADAITKAVVDPVINIASAILLFIAIRILLAILYNIIRIIFTFPVLKQTNKLAGGIIQTVIALVAVYAVLAIIAVSGSDILDGSVLCRTMYENNILISIVART